MSAFITLLDIVCPAFRDFVSEQLQSQMNLKRLFLNFYAVLQVVEIYTHIEDLTHTKFLMSAIFETMRVKILRLYQIINIC